ncbi:MAG: competence/damage-inducible protein A [Alphaproteobacteria bacterium HGW-Alphaproteobacteria-2]|nr:MAG: competence/damage-inducible protein A [Alphaproteobacteria bacterium HGW-Alphaproteobacteria-2]
METPTAAMLVIGDEILSGRTRDSNMHHLAKELTQAGITLAEARVVPDAHARIVAAVRALSGDYTHVFTSGGIGPTHDDITADAVADAFGTPIGVRADARALLVAHYAKTGTELNAARLRMARIPEGATLIENPISAAPGFSLHNVHVMAGVPAIFEAMVASVLPRLRGGPPVLSRNLRVEVPEGEVAEALGAAAAVFADVSMGSYPFIRAGRYGTNLVLRSPDAARLAEAVAHLHATLPAPAVEE